MKAKYSEPEQLPEEAIEKKNWIRATSRSKPSEPCKKCGQADWAMFQACPRWFLFIIDAIIYPIKTELMRWICKCCGSTCRHYPQGCQPHRRFLYPDRIRLVANYVDHDQISSREASQDGKSQIVYASDTDDGINDQHLAHTTILRSVNDLALERNRNTDIIKQAVDLTVDVRLSDFRIPPWKYRTPERKRTLDACRLFVRALKRLRLEPFTNFAPQGLSP